MIEFHKKRGETPLQALDRLRLEYPEHVEEVLSYAGRLDPMAEGVLSVLVGKEENARRQEFLCKDKEYQAEFILGIATDTCDVLGLIQRTDFRKVNIEIVKKTCEDLIHLTQQTYPWYSSKPVEGLSLFEHARKGNTHIKRPVKDIQIYSVTNVKSEENDSVELIKKIVEDIKRVQGDFRQDEIVEEWQNVMAGQAKPAPLCLTAVSCTIKVSSGTYIRGLCEVLEEKIGVPVVLYKLVRTRVF
jgi:tRNA pseudouridine(55) synthase